MNSLNIKTKNVRDWFRISGKLFYLIPVLYIIACTTTSSDKSGRKFNRPIKPWALRSVLDYRPRMLTLALDPECYVAYDLNQCGLFRAWKGGVNWDGTVYNETKAMQPTSWGKDYVSNVSLEGIWLFERKGVKESVDVRFQGYRFEHGQIYLKYSLTLGKNFVEIEERPEFIRDKNGNPGLERMFLTKGVGQDVSVFLSTQSKTLKLERNAETIFRTYFEKIPHQVPAVGPPNSGDVGRYWIERSDCFTCHEWLEKTIGPGFQQIAEKYPLENEVVDQLVKRIKEGGSGVWGEIAMNPHPNLSEGNLKTMVQYILSLDHDDDNTATSGSGKKIDVDAKSLSQEKKLIKPGFGASLDGVHPSYNLSTIHLAETEFKVGGLAFLPDGRLLVATWSPQGSVYILEGVETGDSSQVKIKIIAQGLAEPLGLAVVDGEIFVLQKQELTQLIDHNGDEITDEYKAICNGFGVSTDFHEFAFGLVYKDKHFYANLSLPMRLLANEKPLPDRGKTIKIAMDGSFEWINHGLRQPNGIGIGIDGEIFVTDNQGQWLPANKFIHIRPGDFHGMRWGLPDSMMNLKMVPPTIWLPEHEISNSPTEPSLMYDGPYNGQMMFGDVTHGGIKRVFLEIVNGSYQGVVFRFTQGLEVGINRIRRGPDGALYVGGVGMGGGWSWKETRHGLQRLEYNDKVTFEMLAIRSKPDGFEIEFTEPIAAHQGNLPSDYLVKQWWYLPTASYGGPKMDLETMAIRRVKISSDRTKVRLIIPGLKNEHVVKFDLDADLQSSSGQYLWSSEAWYTLNNIPKEIN